MTLKRRAVPDFLHSHDDVVAAAIFPVARLYTSSAAQHCARLKKQWRYGLTTRPTQGGAQRALVQRSLRGGSGGSLRHAEERGVMLFTRPLAAAARRLR